MPSLGFPVSRARALALSDPSGSRAVSDRIRGLPPPARRPLAKGAGVSLVQLPTEATSTRTPGPMVELSATFWT